VAKITLTMPCYGLMQPDTAFSLLGLYEKSRHLLHDVKWKNLQYIDQARNGLVHDVLEDGGATHMAGLDADMIWPPDLLERLLAHDKPIVGANYFCKMPPYDMVAGDFSGPPGVTGVPKRLPLRELRTGRQRVDVLGMGATLIRTDVLRQMREHYGDERWFRSEETGEDHWFFWRCKQMGIPVWLDYSLVCGHLVPQMVTEAHWKAGHQHQEEAASVPGWCNFADLYSEMVNGARSGAHFVEVGCYLGRSTIIMAKMIAASGKSISFHAVDHFKGHGAEPDELGVADSHDGSLRPLFERNLASYGVSDRVGIIEGDSAESADLFDNGTCDFVFIDADHTCEAVSRDIRAWAPKIRPGGVLAGHDYCMESVRTAVDHSSLLGVKKTSRDCWMWRKPL
jgi:hypothetical protein